MGETKLPPKVCAKNANDTQNTSELEPQYEVWKPDRLNRALSELNQDDRKTMLLFRTVRSILNKVTPENFLKLKEKMESLSIDTPKRMQGVVDIIQKKAINEWKFRALYAKLCGLMRNVQIVNEEGIVQQFAQILIAKCITFFNNSFFQHFEFEKRKREIDSSTDQEAKKFLKREYEIEECHFRKQCVGNCQFIGELFKLDLICRNRIFQMLDRLFKFAGNMSIECSCVILTTIGQFYEKKFEKFSEKYFEQINSLLLNEELSFRIRLLLQNVLDMRNNSWCPRMQLELPKTLRQIELDLLDEENRSEQLGSSNGRVKNSNKSKRNKKKFNENTSR